MTFNELEAIEQCPVGRDVFWSAKGLGIDDAAFDALYRRLEELEVLGRISILDVHRESYTGYRYVARLKMQRLT